MAGPWEKYGAPQKAGPWSKYGGGGVTQLIGKVGKMDARQSGEVSENVQQLSKEDRYAFDLDRVRRSQYADLTDEQWAKAVADPRSKLAPHEAGDLFGDGLTMGLSDEARGAAGAVSALMRGQDPGRAFEDYQRLEQSRRDLGAEKAGLLGTAAQIGGSMLAGRPDVAATRAATTLGRVLQGGKDAAKQGAVYGFAATEGDLVDRLRGAGVGAGIGAGAGAAVPFVANKVGQKVTEAAQRRATNVAVKGAPDAGDLKTAASTMFQQLDQQGVQVAAPRLQQMAVDLVQKFTKLRANPNLDPKAVGALTEVVKAVDEAVNAGAGLALSDLHTLRQIAQKAAQSSEGRDQMFSTQIIKGIDDMIGGLKPADMIGGADPKQAANLMFDAMSTWGRSRRVGLIEEAIYRAQNVASGPENGLRIEFRKLLQNPDTRKLFSAAERQAIEDVVRGNAVSNLAKLLGKFGFGTNGASNMAGGTIGALGASAFGGPLAGLAVAGLGWGARKASEKLTAQAASRAGRVVATPNIPQVGPANLPMLDQIGQGLIRGAQPLAVSRQ